MVVYEVQIQVKPEVAARYEVWLEDHILQILSVPGFLKAHWLNLVDPQSEEPTLVVQYYVRSQDELNRYLTQHAPAFRADGEKLFGGQFTAQRRVLQLKKTFGRE